MALEIELPHARLLAVGRVMWNKLVGRGYENGVHFLWMRQQEKGSIQVHSLDSIIDAIENQGIRSGSNTD